MPSLARNFRFSLRMLTNNPGISAISILALSLGIGITATMYSIVYGAIWRGLPFVDSERIMHLERSRLSQGISSMEVTLHDYLDWREQQTSFEGFAAFYNGTVNLSGSEGPTRYEGAFITSNGFEALRESPHLGRTFRDDEDDSGAEPVIIIGYHVWRDRYDSDPDIVGKTILANGEQMTVVGVMPDGFQFPLLQDVWVPLGMDPLEIPRGQGTTLEVYGRLRDGVTVEHAQVELGAIAQRLELEYPDTNEGVGVIIKPYITEYIGEEAIPILMTFLGAVFLVLLVACANVTNLLLSRAFDRSKEVAVRSALGASRLKVVGQMLTEVSVLAAIGGVLGLGLAYLGVDMFNQVLVTIEEIPYFVVIAVDLPIVLFVIGVTAFCAFVAGIFPSLQASGGNLSDVLNDESRGSSSFRLGRLSKVLIVAQIALSCGLLVGAGLFIKSVVNLGRLDYGFAPETIFTARVGLFESDYPDETVRKRFWEDLRARLGALPGVEAASLVNTLPVTEAWWARYEIEGETYPSESDYPVAHHAYITPGYFDTFDVELLAGRDFDVTDDADSLPVAIANRSFVERFFPNENPIGRRVRFPNPQSDRPWLTIVGVAPDLFMEEMDNFGQPAKEGVYLPLAQTDMRFMSIAARTRGDALEMTTAVRGAVMSLDPDMPIYWIRTMEGVIHQQTWFFWVFGTLFMVFGFVALFLASIGLYGVMSFAVRRRTQEVGIRMALGARTNDVLRLVLKQGLVQLAVGLVLGVALAATLSRMIAVLLYEVEPTDPQIFTLIAVVLVATGVSACLIPARRASRVDPIVALRSQ